MGLEALDVTIADPAPPARKNPPRAGVKAEAAPPPAVKRGPGENPGEAARPALWAPPQASLAGLGKKTAACQGCALSRERPGAPTMGRGSRQPLIAFVGETPAIFEGEAATLLAAMIEKGLKLGPDDFYISCLLKCPLPPDTDFPAQAAAECLPIVHRELTLLRPPVILALGKWPGRFLSGRKDEQLLLLRQRTFSIPGLEQGWLRVSYSLDELLAIPELKKEAWKDLQKIIPVIEKLKSAGTSHVLEDL